MGNENSDFLKIIKERRKKKSDKKFSGTFLDYLNVLKKKPEAVMLAHKRLYKSIVKSGLSNIDVDDKDIQW